MSELKKHYDKVLKEATKAANFLSVSYLANWDQETFMPKNGIKARADLLSFLAQERHKVLTSSKIGSSLKFLQENSPEDPEKQIIVKRLAQDVEKAGKLGKTFVKKFSKETALAANVWKEAHTKDSFKKFLPSLKKVISLCQKKAALLGYEDHPYDALLDEYEPNMTTKTLDELFGSLKPQLISLVKKIASKNGEEKLDLSNKEFPISSQRKLCKDVIEKIGLSPDEYNLATTHHPFCIPIHPSDVRVTTHFHKNDVLKGFSASVHEAGHGLYENNLLAKHYGTPLSEAASIGVHESQSRIYETCIGNSLPFWKHYYPKFQKTFPESLNDVDIDDFVKMVRKVKPSLIRIFADEVTYCLHVILRYEIEKGLIDGSIAPKDIPAIWKQKMQESLGIIPPSDAFGCLQDIHWSIGCFGYFPTYGLGSMYASSLFTTFIKGNVNWASDIGNGDFSKIGTFLEEKIHVHGRKYYPLELMEKACGKPFSSNDYIAYLEHRYL